MVWDAEVQRAQQASRYLVALAQRVLAWYRESGKLEHDTESIMAHLCRNQNYSSERERAAEVLMFLVAGHDTTGFSMAWILCEIAKRPDIQDELAAELAAHGKDSPLLVRVIKEGMRLRPVAAMGSIRQNAEHVTTPEGHVIPAGSECIMPLYLLCREDWIEDPETFRPERWEDGAKQRADLERQIFPFSLGARNCVGQRLAMSTMRSVLSHVLLRFKFGVHSEPVEDFFLTLKPEGARLTVTARGRATATAARMPRTQTVSAN